MRSQTHPSVRHDDAPLAVDSRGVKIDPRKPRRPKRRQTFLPLALGTTGGIALATIAFWFFQEQAESVVEGRADRYDGLIMDAIHRIDNPSMQAVLESVTQLGSHAAIGLAAGLTALAMVRKGHKHDAWTVVISTGGAMAINTILKNIYQRQRPQEQARHIKLPRSHSFPSGHSLLSAATYPIVAHHLVQDDGLAVQALVHSFASLAILSVGFSRIYFGVHFPSDVLGGFAAGFGWLGLTSLAHTLMEKRDE